jgi:hypothetical protein
MTTILQYYNIMVFDDMIILVRAQEASSIEIPRCSTAEKRGPFTKGRTMEDTRQQRLIARARIP